MITSFPYSSSSSSSTARLGIKKDDDDDEEESCALFFCCRARFLFFCGFYCLVAMLFSCVAPGKEDRADDAPFIDPAQEWSVIAGPVRDFRRNFLSLCEGRIK